MKENPSRDIPEKLKREIAIEAGHRCAIPTCRYPRIEYAHINPFSKSKEHKFENLIALCPNCHDLYDKDKKIDLKSMLIYKANLSLLNNRYNDFERRVLQYFLTNQDKNHICLPGPSDLMVYYLVKDDLLLKTDTNSGITSNMPGITDSPIATWEVYQLTTQGRSFINNWEKGVPLE